LRALVLVKPIPDLQNLSISRSLNRVFENGPRLMDPRAAPPIQAAVDGGATVIALSVGHPDDTDGLRRALAMGATEAVLLAHPQGRLLDAAAVVGAIVAECPECDVIFAGSPMGQVGPRLAEALGWAFSRQSKPAPRTVHVIGPEVSARLPSALSILKAARQPIQVLEARPGPAAVQVRSMEVTP
jgi:electron transfer flavoprotein alpha/beta subunit